MAKTLLSFLIKMMILAGFLLTGAGGAIAQSAGDISFVGKKAGRSTIRFNGWPRITTTTNKAIQFATPWWQVNSFTAKENSFGWETVRISIPPHIGPFFNKLYLDSTVTLPRINGPEGWRALSSPVQAISFGDWLGDFWMQGMIGSDNPKGEATILTWDEEDGQLSKPRDMQELTEPGKGYIIYFWEDDDPTEDGVQGGFPKMIPQNAESDQKVVDIAVTATDANENGTIDGYEGFNLLGNPFGSRLSVEALKGALEKAGDRMNAYLYRWDPRSGNGNGSIKPLNEDAVIAPYEAFWVRYLGADAKGSVRMDSSSLAKENPRAVYDLHSKPEGSFELQLEGEKWFDVYQLEFNEQGAIGEDPLDGYKLFSLNRNSINLYSTVGNGSRLALNTLPNSLEERVEIPLSFSAPDRQKLSFRWERPAGIPDHWEIYLTDRYMDREINLRTVNSYSFQLQENESASKASSTADSERELLNTVQNASVNEDRFALIVEPSTSIIEEVGETAPESVSLNPNFPNPFTTTTTIPFELVEKTDVKLTIWNMIGQKVATLVDGVREAGAHEDVRWNASNMPSGMYIARLEAGGEVFTRKMTLIK